MVMHITKRPAPIALIAALVVIVGGIGFIVGWQMRGESDGQISRPTYDFDTPTRIDSLGDSQPYDDQQQQQWELDAIRREADSQRYSDRQQQQWELDAIRREAESQRYSDRQQQQWELDAIRREAESQRYSDEQHQQWELDAIRREADSQRYSDGLYGR